MSTALAVKDEKQMIRDRQNEGLEERGLTVYWLAKELDMRLPTLYAIANNKNEKINLNYLYMIMDILDITDMNEILVKDDTYM